MRLLILPYGRKLTLIQSRRQDNLYFFKWTRDNDIIPKVDGAVVLRKISFDRTRTHYLKVTAMKIRERRV